MKNKASSLKIFIILALIGLVNVSAAHANVTTRKIKCVAKNYENLRQINYLLVTSDGSTRSTIKLSGESGVFEFVAKDGKYVNKTTSAVMIVNKSGRAVSAKLFKDTLVINGHYVVNSAPAKVLACQD